MTKSPMPTPTNITRLLTVVGEVDELEYAKGLQRTFDTLGSRAADAWRRGGGHALQTVMELWSGAQAVDDTPTTWALFRTVFQQRIGPGDAGPQALASRTATRLVANDLNPGRVLRLIANAQKDGKGVPAVTRLIRDSVPAGRFRSSSVRARVIARTEMKKAQNIGSLANYQGLGAQRVKIVDGRLPTSDSECKARHGLEVPLAEAEALIADEHPNGTMSFVPVLPATLPPPITPIEREQNLNDLRRRVGRRMSDRAERLGRTLRRPPRRRR